MSFGGPHEPWDAPEPYASMYDPRDMPAPRKVFRETGARPRGLLDERFGLPGGPTEEEAAACRANYAGNITLIDDQIGEILEVITARGELDNTVIAFTSDHGEMNGDCGLIYKKNFLDGAVRVPMLIRTPETARCRAGQRDTTCDAPVEWIDLGVRR